MQRARKFTILFSILGVSSSVLLFWFTRRVIYALVPLSLALFSILAIRNPVGVESARTEESQPRKSRRLALLLGTLFYALFTFSVLDSWATPESVGRGLSFFIVAAALSFLIITESQMVSLSRLGVASILLQLVLFSILLRWSAYSVFPTVIGLDPWYHLGLTDSFLVTNRIPTGTAYSWEPIMQLLTATVGLTGREAYKGAAFYAVGLVQASLDPVLLFLISRRELGARVGLVAASLLPAASFHLGYGIALIPNTLATTLSLLVIYLVIRFTKGATARASALVLLLFLVIILTHALVPILLLMVLTGYWLTRYLKRRADDRKMVAVRSSTLLVLATGTFGWWAYASGYVSNLALAIRWGFDTDLITGVDPGRWANYISQVPLGEQLISFFGLAAYVGLGGAGWLHVSQYLKKAHNAWAAGLIGIVFASVGAGALVTHIFLVWDRWIYFAQILLAPPAAVLLISLSKARWGGFRKLGVSVAISGLVFLSAIGPQSAADFNGLTPHITVRYALTSAEITALEFAQGHSNQHVYGDSYYGAVQYEGILADRYVPIDAQISSRNFG